MLRDVCEGYGVEENFMRVCKGLYRGVEMMVVLNGRKSSSLQ